MKKTVRRPTEHVDLLKEKLKKLLNWPLPQGRVKDVAIPNWLKKECLDALKGIYEKEKRP